MVQIRFEATVVYWRGPSPFFFAPIPPKQAEEIRRLSKAVTYGWGMIPVEASLNGAVFRTSLYPKDETYVLPLKAAVRKKTNITAGDSIAVEMTIGATQR